jgi:hypothetical protein
MVEASIFLLFKRDKQDVKEYFGWTFSLIENGVSPKLNFWLSGWPVFILVKGRAPGRL